MYRLTLIIKTWVVPAVLILGLVFVSNYRYTYTPYIPYILVPSILLAFLLTILCVGRHKIASRLLSGKTCNSAGPQIIIGGGYQALLQQKFLSSGSISRVKSGRSTEDGWWHAGTSIRDIQYELGKKSLSLTSHPSSLSTTIGGWIFSNAHGSGGTLWKSNFKTIRVDEQDSCGNMIKTFDITRKSYLFGDDKIEKDVRKYIIRQVQISPVSNDVTERLAFDIQNEDDCNCFLSKPSYLRLIMVKSSVATAFLWVPTSHSLKENKNFWTELLYPPWLATLLPSVLFKCIHRKRWNRYMTLKNANIFGPSDDFPIIEAMFLPFSFLYYNFELYVKCNVTPALLLRTIKIMQSAFSSGKLKGRVEIRGSRSKLFLDFALTSSYVAAFEALHEAIPNASFVLHRGKFQPKVSNTRDPHSSSV